MKNQNEKRPLVAVDAVLFTVDEGELKVLLIQIDGGIYNGKWALPGGLVNYNESLDGAVIRVLSEKANVEGIFMEQLYTFGDPKRDKRSRSVSVAYYALVSHPEKLDIKTLDYYKEIEWFNVRDLPETAFDHEKIINFAHDRLKSKLSYSNVAYSLLPKEFTLPELRNVYEVIYNEKFDKRNFRKSMISKGLVEDTGEKQSNVDHRPAKLYRFKKRNLELFE